MKFWKGATFVSLFCGMLLYLHLTRNFMASSGPARHKSSTPMLSSSSLSLSSNASSSSSLPSKSSSLLSKPMPSSSSILWSSLSSSPSRMKAGLHRTMREADNISSLFSQFTYLLQSFTEGELNQVINTLMERSTRNSRRSSRSSVEEMLEESKENVPRNNRTKRRRLRWCALRQVEVTVGELGLGYDSHETLLFRYCSGRCNTNRRNYDITLEHLRKSGLIKNGDPLQYSPCCRPVTYEKDISFLDGDSKYHTVQEVSARECRCT